jgi:hypothetical protein
LGLDERGVEAREERFRQDQLRLQREMEGTGQDLGDSSQLVRNENEREGRYLTPHTPSPRRGKRKGGEKEVGPVGKRDIPFLSPRYHRGGGGGEELEDPEEIDQSGPVLRRGSKRLSDLAEPGSESSSPDPENDYATGQGQVRRKSRASTLQKMSKRSVPKQKEKGKKGIVSREGQEVEVVVHDSASQDEADASEKTASPVLTGADEGDWERTRKEATCLAGRMNWTFVEFDCWFARFIHVSVFCSYTCSSIECFADFLPCLP